MLDNILVEWDNQFNSDDTKPKNKHKPFIVFFNFHFDLFMATNLYVGQGR